jgi:hypothetical protein
MTALTIAQGGEQTVGRGRVDLARLGGEVLLGAERVELAELGRLDHLGDPLVALVLLLADLSEAGLQVGGFEVDEAG